ncbi:MAG: hypothetical protein HWN67_16550, partial [Candidatus Helarchaeota archaeon]|nr:hypothetical protein [Candidatus Helarchaeota archaeon]
SQMGRWEVPAQKWIDLSNDDFGVTLINYSKYGFNVIENVLKMTVLRTPQYPRGGAALQISDLKKITDLGKHSVKYALKIHKGKKFAINEAHEFNDDFLVSKTSPHKGILPKKFSFLKIEPNTIILSAFKSYEDGKSDESKYILRIYEAYGNQTSCKINFASNFKILEVFETDLLEFNPKKINDHNEDTIEVQLGKFEIKTLLISLKLSENL